MSDTGELKVAEVEDLIAALSDATRDALSGPENPPLAQLLPQVYDELRRVAGSYLRHERSDHTLQPTALVHEAYLRLQNQPKVTWQNRAHLLGLSATMMRRILINHAEARAASKRRGDAPQVSLDLALDVLEQRNLPAELLHQALRDLEALDPRQGKIVELRFFGGLSVEETAEVLGISPATVKREWSVAKLWLKREMAARG